MNISLEMQIASIVEEVLIRYMTSIGSSKNEDLELFTTKEAAGILKVDPQVVRRLCRDQLIGCNKVCGSYRISKKDLTSYVNRSR